VVSYYDPEDVVSGRLVRPLEDPTLNGILGVHPIFAAYEADCAESRRRRRGGGGQRAASNGSAGLAGADAAPSSPTTGPSSTASSPTHSLATPPISPVESPAPACAMALPLHARAPRAPAMLSSAMLQPPPLVYASTMPPPALQPPIARAPTFAPPALAPYAAFDVTGAPIYALPSPEHASAQAYAAAPAFTLPDDSLALHFAHDGQIQYLGTDAYGGEPFLGGPSGDWTGAAYYPTY
jgi:hypothetical protein